jgi:hypothetical protein
LQGQEPRAEAVGPTAEAREALVAGSVIATSLGPTGPLRGFACPQRQVSSPARLFGALDRGGADTDRRRFGGAGDRGRLLDPRLQLGDRRRQRPRGKPPLVGVVALTGLDALKLRAREAESSLAPG